MTTTVLMTRHGQTESNITGYYMGWSDEDLNQTGRSQAVCLSKRLANTHIDAIYSSPLKRALTTAKTVAGPHKLEVTTLQDLIEMQLGAWQTLHIDEMARRWPQVWKEWRTDPTRVTPPGGESFMSCYERGIRSFKSLAEKHKEQTILIVTHEIIVKVAAIHALGAATDVYRRFDVFNTALSKMYVADDGTARLILLNDVSHLPENQISGNLSASAPAAP